MVTLTFPVATGAASKLPASARMPIVFIGHGSPRNAIDDNTFTRALVKFGQRWPRPKAILVISAHWLTRGGTAVATSPTPQTIYDFGGFPEEMYQIKYRAPGSPAFARQLVENVKSTQIRMALT